MGGLELFQPLDEFVVFEVGNFRGGLDIVFPIVAGDFLAKPIDFGGGVERHNATS
jgi:hypothetical protein